MHNLNKNNLENNLYATISVCNKLQSGLFSRCVFTNIDEIYYHPILKFIFVINNLTNNNDKKTKLLIMYNTNDYLT